MEALNLLKKYGDKGYIGEEVTQLEHAFQCAMLAEKHCEKIDIPIKNDFILGCLFHDIGHLLCYDNPELETMGDYGTMDHEKVGEDYMRSIGFSENVCELVGNHINTKRYLISINPEYYTKLSEASKKTYEYQGGKLTDTEIDNFRKNNLFQYHLKLREFDERAKSTESTLLEKIKKMDSDNYYSRYIIL
jgi:2-amino-1-hydroxyethylphosphonate dioxygenase (glycine-forming)